MLPPFSVNFGGILPADVPLVVADNLAKTLWQLKEPAAAKEAAELLWDLCEIPEIRYRLPPARCRVPIRVFSCPADHVQAYTL